MTHGLELQFWSLVRQRFQERDRGFSARLVEVQQEHNRRRILRSSITVAAMYAELRREFEESAKECVKVAADLMASGPTALLVPRRRRVQSACSRALSERKAAAEEIFQSASASILASLSNRGLTEPYRSLDDSFVQLQCDASRLELQMEHRRLFWLKADRMLKLLPLLKKLRTFLVVLVVVGLSYFGGLGIVEAWKSLRDSVAPAQDAGESVEKTGVLVTRRQPVS